MLKRLALVLPVALAFFATPALADNWHRHGGHSRNSFSLSLGFYQPYPAYRPYYYYPYPAYYAPPPVVYAPPPVVYGAPAVYASPSVAAVPTRDFRDSSGRYCREYQRTAVINGMEQPVYGTACLMPDGSWRIVSE
jgi:hypothetical protein